MNCKDENDEFEGQELEELEEMIKDGEIRACCPLCRSFMSSIYEEQCTICKAEINVDDVVVEFIDWSVSN